MKCSEIDKKIYHAVKLEGQATALTIAYRTGIDITEVNISLTKLHEECVLEVLYGIGTNQSPFECYYCINHSTPADKIREFEP